jgi:hypothetical protein
VDRGQPSTPTVCHHTAPPPCQRRSPVAHMRTSVRLLSWSRRAASMRRPLQPSDAAAGPRAEELARARRSRQRSARARARCGGPGTRSPRREVPRPGGGRARRSWQWWGRACRRPLLGAVARASTWAFLRCRLAALAARACLVSWAFFAPQARRAGWSARSPVVAVWPRVPPAAALVVASSLRPRDHLSLLAPQPSPHARASPLGPFLRRRLVRASESPVSSVTPRV